MLQLINIIIKSAEKYDRCQFKMADKGATVRPPKYFTPSENSANDWKLWMMQYKFYSTATKLNKESQEIQIANLMTHLGPECIAIYETFEIAEEDNKVETIVKKFEEHFIPQSNITYERYIFQQNRARM